MRGFGRIACAAAGLAVAGAAWAGPPPVVPVIELTPGEGTLRIEGFVQGAGQGAGATVTATLGITHAGAGGGSTIRQSRRIALDGSRAAIGATSIGFGPQSYLNVELVVEADGAVIARSQTEIGRR